MDRTAHERLPCLQKVLASLNNESPILIGADLMCLRIKLDKLASHNKLFQAVSILVCVFEVPAYNLGKYFDLVRSSSG